MFGGAYKKYHIKDDLISVGTFSIKICSLFLKLTTRPIIKVLFSLLPSLVTFHPIHLSTGPVTWEDV